MGEIKGKSVLLFPYCTLQRHKCTVFAQVPKNMYSTLGQIQHTCQIIMTSHCKQIINLLHTTIRFHYHCWSLSEACCLPLYHHFTSRRRCATIYTAINSTTTVAVRCHSESLLFAAISQSLVLCITVCSDCHYHYISGMCLHNKLLKLIQ